MEPQRSISPVSANGNNKQMLKVMCTGLALLAAQQHNRAEAQQPAKQHFNIPAQSLQSALNQFSEDADIQMSYPAQLSKGIKTNGISGDYTREEALNQLLAGSGLASSIANNTVTLEKANHEKVPANAPKGNSMTTLKAMTVVGEAENDPNDPYNRDYSIPNDTTATKTDTPVMNTPASVQVVPKAVIQDQQSIGLQNVLQNVSGVSKGWGFGAGANENYQIRGFTNSSIYRDGVLTPNSINISLANTERVEVLKGPAGMLYGRSEPGGLVNVITKRPQKESYYSLQQQFGSYDTYRTLLDATGTLNKEGSLLYRVNYEHLGSNSFRDFVYDDRDFVAPSLTWMISQDTQFDLDFMYQNRKTVSDSGIPFDLQLSGAIPGKIPRNFRANEPSDFNNSQFYEGDATLTHHFNEDWKVRGRFSIIR